MHSIVRQLNVKVTEKQHAALRRHVVTRQGQVLVRYDLVLTTLDEDRPVLLRGTR